MLSFHFPQNRTQFFSCLPSNKESKRAGSPKSFQLLFFSSSFSISSFLRFLFSSFGTILNLLPRNTLEHALFPASFNSFSFILLFFFFCLLRIKNRAWQLNSEFNLLIGTKIGTRIRILEFGNSEILSEFHVFQKISYSPESVLNHSSYPKS